jgi:hypothetical protein
VDCSRRAYVLLVVGAVFGGHAAYAAQRNPDPRGGDAARAAGVKPAAPAFSGDQRVRGPARAEQVGGPLADYLAAVSDLHAVRFGAARPFDKRALTLPRAGQDLPATLTSLARLYHLTWQVGSDGKSEYVLRETPADRRRRARAEQAAKAKALAALQARWEEVRQLAFAPEETLRKRAEQGDAKAKSLLRNPFGRSRSQAAFSLPKPILDEFWRTGSVQVPLSQLSPALRNLVRDPNPSVTSVRRLDGSTVDPGPPPPDTLRLSLGGTPQRPTVWMTAMQGFSGRELNLLYAEGWSREPPEERRKRMTRRGRDYPENHPLRKLVTLREPASRRSLERGERPRGARPLAEFVQQLAAQGSVTIAAECDYQPRNASWLGQQWWLAADIVKEPLHRALDLLCSDFEYEWEYVDGVILLRPEAWYLEPAEREYQNAR